MEVLENRVKDYWWGARQWLYCETEKVQILLGPNRENPSPYFFYEIIENSKPSTVEPCIDLQRFFFSSIYRAINWIEYFHLTKLFTLPCCYFIVYYYIAIIWYSIYYFMFISVILTISLFRFLLFSNTLWIKSIISKANTDFIRELTINRTKKLTITMTKK